MVRADAAVDMLNACMHMYNPAMVAMLYLSRTAFQHIVHDFYQQCFML